MKHSLWILVFGAVIHWTGATHFRGAAFSWSPVVGGAPNEVEISYRVAWRRTYSASTFCDVDTILSERLLGPVNAGFLMCHAGCSGKVGNVNFLCTDFSQEEDWAGGTNSYHYVFPNSGKFDLRWTGRGWLETETHALDAEWSLRMIVDLTSREDTRRINTSPKATMAPVVRLQLGCDMAVKIPVLDEDNDVIRCRWPLSAKQECGGVCQQPEGVSLSMSDCRLEFTSPPSAGYYVMAVQVEDFSPTDRTFSRPLSSVPLQFLAHVYQAGSPCSAQPVFLSPTPDDGSCIGLQQGTMASLMIVIRTKDRFTGISEVTTASSQGMTKGHVLPYGADPRNHYVNITWSVTSQQQGESIFCFAATDTTQTTSEQRCIYLILGATPPSATHITNSEDGQFLYIHFDQDVVIGDRNKMVTVYDKSTMEEIFAVSYGSSMLLDGNNRTVVITMPPSTQLKGVHYVQMEAGLVRSTHSCGAESLAVDDDVSLFFFVALIVKRILFYVQADCPDPPSTSAPTTKPTDPPVGTTAATTDTTVSNNYWIIAVVIAAVLLLVLIVVIVIAVRRKRKADSIKSTDERRLEQWAHLQNLRMGYDGPYQPDFNSLDVKFR